ncbi:MAG: alpha-galactosidase [Ruminococcaceae bacterium]|nr:alpha-galactosidase [Oscillospiraceae bacterium]
MAIIVNEQKNQFYLHTKNTSYVFENVCGLLAHSYWGKRVEDVPPMAELYPLTGIALVAADLPEPYRSSDILLQEYSTYGSCDLRTPSFSAVYSDGSPITKLAFKGYKIYNEKLSPKGLPATYTNEGDICQTLEVELFDELKKVSVFLYYCVFEEKDIITRFTKVVNNSEEAFTMNSVQSFCADFPHMNYDMINLHGAWAREGHIERKPLFVGTQQVNSKNGASGPNHVPFIALADKDTTEDSGDAFGLTLVYSGNWYAGVDVDRHFRPRLMMGLNPFNFEWQMKSGEEFYAPEVIMSYSSQGLGQMSRQFHNIVRENLCRGNYRDTERFVLVNNWEATYMDFTEDKLIEIADAAAELGVDMFVLDDGWFGKRNTATTSLGDWYVNTEKLPSGLKGLGEKINAKGLKFGLWFEPEMISPDSDLYRAHPDWCLHTNGRPRTPCRYQLTLDLTRKDVCDYIVDFLTKTLSENPINYVKWDMNRHFSEAGSALLAAKNQREVAHRYMLGLYSILERVTTAFPNVLFEGCSSGGGRFDAGILHYMPQVWSSDDSDAVERLYIQEGLSTVFPFSTMGAHVSAVPNHQIERNTPIKLRGLVALPGQFGFELDLSKMSEEDKTASKELIKAYKQYGEVFHRGEYFKLSSIFKGQNTAWEFVSEDKNTVIVMLYNIQGKLAVPHKVTKLKGLDAAAKYEDIKTGKVYGGDTLMNLGIFHDCDHDQTCDMLVFKKV